jgi:hypothetical protein
LNCGKNIDLDFKGKETTKNVSGHITRVHGNTPKKWNVTDGKTTAFDCVNAFRNTSNYAGKGIFKPGIEFMKSIFCSLPGSKS